jgi:hypothetical protein
MSEANNAGTQLAQDGFRVKPGMICLSFIMIYSIRYLAVSRVDLLVPLFPCQFVLI